MLSETRLRQTLRTKILGQGLIELYDRIGSTNARARELAAAGAPEGALVLANQQTAGHGRFGRTWHSPAGLNLYFSLVLRPELPAPALSWLPLAAGLAAAETIKDVTGLSPELKWPNDLLLKGKKIAGILVEGELGPGGIEFAVLGLGLNVNTKSADFPAGLAGIAGSLRMITGRLLDRTVLLASLLNHLETEYRVLGDGRTGDLIKRYREVCRTLGAKVRFRHGRETRQGLAIGVSEAGELEVRLEGTEDLVRLNAGEVTMVK